MRGKAHINTSSHTDFVRQSMSKITSVEQLQSIYGEPGQASIVKVSDKVTKEYQIFIEASSFVSLATVGPEGLDCSPRGDLPGFVRVFDSKTLMIPDRKGNNRIDSLCNIVRDPRVALLFLIPGSGTTIRVNGEAHLSIEPELLASFAVKGQAPRSVVVVQIKELYFQCARAIVRSKLWDASQHVESKNLPTAGQILSSMTSGKVGGEAYDKEWPERAKKSLW